jgi:putative membrane protein
MRGLIDMSSLLAAVDPWRWQPHPEVWLLVGAVVAMGIYVVRVIGPKVVPAGRPVVSRREKVAFWTGVAVLWIASDWPIHDISEEYLYLMHMVQHFLLTLVVPPLFLIATPEWLARLVLDGDGFIAHWVKQLTRPIPAMVLFNGMLALSHAPGFVNLTVEVGYLHYLAHVLIVLAAFGVWMPVVGPLPERRLSLPGQMLYLFLLSILPTLPAAWLTIAAGSVYDAYDHANRLWGFSVTEDQQAAGLFMKLFGGFYLWSIITYLFFTWASRHEEAERAGRRVDEREVLTWQAVSDHFERAPAPAEPVTPRTPG